MNLTDSIIAASVLTAAVFYAFTVAVFLVSRKNRLNYALASQKVIWLVIILTVALPAYTRWYPALDRRHQTVLWASLAAFSWWVMYEVYRANWHGGINRFFHQLWCKASGMHCELPDPEDR